MIIQNKLTKQKNHSIRVYSWKIEFYIWALLSVIFPRVFPQHARFIVDAQGCFFFFFVFQFSQMKSLFRREKQEQICAG